jgi:serine/threonine protein phosphatase PrpC
MPRQFIHTSISTITDTKSMHTTEDTYFVHHNGQHLTLMVADGTPQRLKTTGSLKPILTQYGNGTKPGRYAASLTRDVVAEKTITDPQMPVRDIPLVANQRLREELESVYGDISSTAVLHKEPNLDKLQDDPRFVRLILPACCITVARLDLHQGTLSYAHGGDTALFLLHRDGRTVQITPDQMVQHDDKMRLERRYVLQKHQPKDEIEFRALATNAQAINIDNGIYHNYEDEHGNTDVALGVGVINGLPQLEAYLVADTLSIDDLEGMVLTSDGMFWPAPLDETAEEAQARVNHMGNLIRQRGLDGYLQALHEEELADTSGERYQHFGKLDDATAIHVQLERK